MYHNVNYIYHMNNILTYWLLLFIINIVITMSERT